MRKHPPTSRKLHLAKESIRYLLSPDLRAVAGAFSCGGFSACDCTGGGETLGPCATVGCTKPQY